MPLTKGAAALASSSEPSPPVTLDQLTLLKTDNICSAKASGFAELGIDPRAAEMIVGEYLAPFRPGGRFAAQKS